MSSPFVFPDFVKHSLFGYIESYKKLWYSVMGALWNNQENKISSLYVNFISGLVKLPVSLWTEFMV